MNQITSNRLYMPYGRAEAIVSSSHKNIISGIAIQCLNNQCLDDETVHLRFIEKYRNWIISTKTNIVHGLDNFSVAAYSNGTTESFDKFYLKNKNRRIRCFKGEYMYHQAAGRNYFSDWRFIEDDDLKSNDAVIISQPFSDTGNQHPLYKETLDRCAELAIPVLVDCAFFGLCSNVLFDFTHPAITDITFSLSKFFPVAHLRIGIRFTKTDDDDTLLVSHKTKYINRIGAAVGLKIFDLYRADYNIMLFKETQIKLCKQLDVTPSNSVIFGIDENKKYPEYNRGYISNRLCLSKYLVDGQLLIS